jgi:hypothetical protein
MTDPLTVRAGEKGIVRLFALDMHPEQARFLREPGAAAQVLGVPALDEGEIEVFAVADLEELGLEGYLTQGFGITPDQIAPDRARLTDLTGWAMAVRSRAFGGQALHLAPADTVRLIGAWAEPGTDWTGGRIDTASARPGGGASPRATRQRAQRIGGTVFALVIAVVLAIVWLVAR